ncbi:MULTISPECIES: hypothetical protein [unclassified Bradyrhizobium]|uniref:hypothetical protein n=1 Tax=unclassified Bradyrhizobium TaxID=2631580 RepID=UPI001FF7987C|nr:MULTISPECIES: hypothetical protein [unclassified Bradyrhizobium]MCK1714398.1 hypothetical protein [Bradyrhizobium sp. 143]MCK1730893.1 hypothetical protein [Bradyrhizobium sp. 142]
MSRTVTIHSVFVTAKLARLALNTLEDVLHCDKVSWFRHNQAAPDRVDGRRMVFSLAPFLGTMV